MAKLEIPKIQIADAVLEIYGFVPVNMSPADDHLIPTDSLDDADSVPTEFVYLMKNSNTGLVKVGYSKNPENREKAVRQGKPGTSLIGYYPGSRVDELIIHVKYQSKHSHGEWFRLDSSDVSDIIRYFKRGHCA